MSQMTRRTHIEADIFQVCRPMLWKLNSMFSRPSNTLEGRRVSPATHVIAKEAFRREEIILGGQIVVLLKQRDLPSQIFFEMFQRFCEPSIQKITVLKMHFYHALSLAH